MIRVVYVAGAFVALGLIGAAMVRTADGQADHCEFTFDNDDGGAMVHPTERCGPELQLIP